MLKTIIVNLSREKWIQQLLSHEATIYVVGGCVRDEFLRKPIKDVDMVIEDLSLDFIKKTLNKFGETKIVGESFSVLKFRPTGHVGEDYDIAVPRMDRKIGVGHKGFETITNGMTIKDDLKRRDFTINSMAVNIMTGELLDPFKGTEDIMRKQLKATDSNAFVEDPLRMVRAIQFAARFNFSIEHNTLELMKKNCELINEIAGERIEEEFDKIISKHGSTSAALTWMEKSNLDKGIFGKKFAKNLDFKYFEGLDHVSFYHVMCTLGGVNPGKFYKTRFKGNAKVIRALEVLGDAFITITNHMFEPELRWRVFNILKASPMLINAMVVPANVASVMQDMREEKIPMKLGDIPVTGDELMAEFGIGPGAELGALITKMYQDALMEKYDWKSKEKTLEYLKNK